MATNGSIPMTGLTHFILVGFQTSSTTKTLLTAVFSLAYALTLLENATIVAIVKWDAKLHTPMYFFLSKLSCLETLFVSITLPNMLNDLASGNNRISVWGCLLQLYFFLSIGSSECFLLAAMAYDRYVAICKPLLYHSVMTPVVCWSLTGSCMFWGFFPTSFGIGLIAQLHFCHSRVDHYFCDVSPIIKLSCEDISTIELVDFVTSLFVLLVSLVLIIVSYTYIISAVKKITSDRGWKKSLSTCSSHLIVVVLFFGTTIFMYARPQAIDSYDSNKLLSLLYSFIIPMLNPVIYTLRNSDIRNSIQNTFRICFFDKAESQTLAKKKV
ncbi:olfactory receptor 6B9-like [Hyperolius riggenbachi]|uniref:olfactory receptor 6B9-like n=1 Tax=Hyperolius riggenbachi TaxID=752182 RepID=UPI0035A3C16A